MPHKEVLSWQFDQVISKKHKHVSTKVDAFEGVPFLWGILSFCPGDFVGFLSVWPLQAVSTKWGADVLVTARVRNFWNCTENFNCDFLIVIVSVFWCSGRCLNSFPPPKFAPQAQLCFLPFAPDDIDPKCAGPLFWRCCSRRYCKTCKQMTTNRDLVFASQIYSARLVIFSIVLSKVTKTIYSFAGVTLCWKMYFIPRH